MRVLLADDQAWLRSAVRLLLEQESDLEVVGEAGEANALLSIAATISPDLILLDWELPGIRADGGGRFLGRLHRCCPHTEVIVLSGRPEASIRALDAGADYFVSKADPPDSFLSVLRAIQRAHRTTSVR